PAVADGHGSPPARVPGGAGRPRRARAAHRPGLRRAEAGPADAQARRTGRREPGADRRGRLDRGLRARGGQAMTAPTAQTTDYRWAHKHLLALEDLSARDMRHLFQTARGFEEVSTRSVKKVPALRGKVVVNLFFEDSTRTRSSFSLAASRLSADVLDFA